MSGRAGRPYTKRSRTLSLSTRARGDAPLLCRIAISHQRLRGLIGRRYRHGAGEDHVAGQRNRFAVQRHRYLVRRHYHPELEGQYPGRAVRLDVAQGGHDWDVGKGRRDAPTVLVPVSVPLTTPAATMWSP